MGRYMIIAPGMLWYDVESYHGGPWIPLRIPMPKAVRHDTRNRATVYFKREVSAVLATLHSCHPESAPQGKRSPFRPHSTQSSDILQKNIAWRSAHHAKRSQIALCCLSTLLHKPCILAKF